jgi:hypothetical protein
MKQLFLSAILALTVSSCSKGISYSDYVKSMLAGKTWFLDYTMQGDQTKSFIGKSTYFIQFTNNGTTSDSDGLIGNFTIEEKNKICSIMVNVVTQNGSPATYTYQIEQIGSDNLIVSYLMDGKSIKKIFSTTH